MTAGTTNLKGVWAGGDCRAGGLDLTVEAVEHGKQSGPRYSRLRSLPEPDATHSGETPWPI